MTRRTRIQTQAAVQETETVQLMVLLRVVRHRSVEDFRPPELPLGAMAGGWMATGAWVPKFQFVCSFLEILKNGQWRYRIAIWKHRVT